jgi:hypothetical protein
LDDKKEIISFAKKYFEPEAHQPLAEKNRRSGTRKKVVRLR